MTEVTPYLAIIEFNISDATFFGIFKQKSEVSDHFAKILFRLFNSG
jgi:hypothetical protein